MNTTGKVLIGLAIAGTAIGIGVAVSNSKKKKTVTTNNNIVIPKTTITPTKKGNNGELLTTVFDKVSGLFKSKKKKKQEAKDKFDAYVKTSMENRPTAPGLASKLNLYNDSEEI